MVNLTQAECGGLEGVRMWHRWWKERSTHAMLNDTCEALRASNRFFQRNKTGRKHIAEIHMKEEVNSGSGKAKYIDCVLNVAFQL